MSVDNIEFELTFEVEGLTSEADDTLAADFDVLSGVGHDGTQFITISTLDTSAIRAARKAAKAMHQAGVKVLRLREELVSRADIAERAEVTQQAVGSWIRRERATAVPFPKPFNPVNGGVYLWGEVNEWLRTTGKVHDDWSFPSREDHILFNADLHNWLPIQSPEAKVPVSVSFAEIGNKVLFGGSMPEANITVFVDLGALAPRPAGQYRNLWRALHHGPIPRFDELSIEEDIQPIDPDPHASQKGVPR